MSVTRATNCFASVSIQCVRHGMRAANVGWVTFVVFQTTYDGERVRKMTEVDPRQFGSMPGKSTIDAIYIARQLMGKGIEGNLVILGFCGLREDL